MVGPMVCVHQIALMWSILGPSWGGAWVAPAPAAAPRSPADSFQRGQYFERSGELDGAARAYLEAYEAIEESEGAHARKAQALARYVLVQLRLSSRDGAVDGARQAHAVVTRYLRLLRATYLGGAASVSGYSMAIRLLADLDPEVEASGPQRDGTEPLPPPPRQPPPAALALPRSEPRGSEPDRGPPAAGRGLAAGRRLAAAGAAALSLGALSSLGLGVGLGLGYRSSKQYLESPTDRDVASERGYAANASAVVFGTLAGTLIATGTTMLIVGCRRARATTKNACFRREKPGSTRMRRRI